MAELKDRERELNAMVTSHHKQVQAWEQDRRRMLVMEQRGRHLDGKDVDSGHEGPQICSKQTLLFAQVSSRNATR